MCVVVADLVAEVFADLLATLVDRPAWMADAACREHPTLTWWPGPHDHAGAAAARAVCAGCLVRGECLAFALDHDRTAGAFGIYGGMSAHQRNLLLRHRDGTAA
jgi:WhiB family redox-sensing transcriptional regulator